MMTAETKRRHIAAALAAGAAALTVMWTPVGLIETVVSSSGISEILPAAAPPLGTTARVLMALFAALMAWGAGWMLGREKSHAEEVAGDEMTGDEINDQGGQDMGFALSKLTALASRRRGAAHDRDQDLPVLRRADAHPDAPVRQPIFASRDLGGESLFTRPLQIVEEERGPIEDAAGLSLPAAPEPMEEAALFDEMPDAGRGEDHIPSIAPGGQWQDEEEMAGPSFAFAPLDAPEEVGPRFAFDEPVAHDDEVAEEAIVEAVAEVTGEADDEAAFAEPVAAIELIEDRVVDIAPVWHRMQEVEPIAHVSIAELTARLERGLARRMALDENERATEQAEAVMPAEIAAAPFAAPAVTLAEIPAEEAVPTRASVDDEVEEALRVALGTLQKLTARAG